MTGARDPMPAPLFLKPDVFAVQIEDDLVLLDTAADRYVCFPEAGAGSLSPDRRVLRIPALPDGLAPLLAACASPAPLPPDLPQRSLPEAPALTARHVRWLLGAGLDLATAYPGRAFAGMLGAAGRLRDRRPLDPAADPRALAAAFSRLVVWAPIPRKCLVRSLLLLLFLARAGARADWVFAVRTWPFGAHCWLQAGGTCLDDEPERLAGYHPILVV